jgi:hypothetical protein
MLQTATSALQKGNQFQEKAAARISRQQRDAPREATLANGRQRIGNGAEVACRVSGLVQFSL